MMDTYTVELTDFEAWWYHVECDEFCPKCGSDDLIDFGCLDCGWCPQVEVEDVS